MWNWIEDSHQKLNRILRIIENWRKEKYTKVSDGKMVILKKVS
jgi:hypothetical protein